MSEQTINAEAQTVEATEVKESKVKALTKKTLVWASKHKLILGGSIVIAGMAAGTVYCIAKAHEIETANPFPQTEEDEILSDSMDEIERLEIIENELDDSAEDDDEDESEEE